MALSQAQIIASTKAAQAAAQPTTEAMLPTAETARAAAAKSMNAETKKRLAVTGAAGAVGFWFGGPIGAALGAAGGYAFMVIKKQGIGFGG